MLFSHTSIQEFFPGFFIISFNKLVNVTWDDERAFNQKFGILSIPDDFHFWGLVNAAFSSSRVMCSHSSSFTFSFPFSIFPIQLADTFSGFFLSPYPFSKTFSIELFGIRLEDLVLPVEFVTFIKLSFRLCFYLYFLL